MRKTVAPSEIKTVAATAIAVAKQQPDKLEALMELSELVLRATKAARKEKAVNVTQETAS